MRAIIRPPEAAQITGLQANEIRRQLRMGLVSWGKAIPSGVTGSGNPRFRYEIFSAKLLKELGREEEVTK